VPGTARDVAKEHVLRVIGQRGRRVLLRELGPSLRR
jgi:hypothetical protein